MDEEVPAYTTLSSGGDDQLTAELVWTIIRQTAMFSKYTGVRHEIFIGEYEILKNQERIECIQNYINSKYMINTSRSLHHLQVGMHCTRPYLCTIIIERDPVKSEILIDDTTWIGRPLDPVNSKSSSMTNPSSSKNGENIGFGKWLYDIIKKLQ